MRDIPIEDNRTNARRLMQRAIDFHGHLGPFLVLGVRMGMIARSVLDLQGRDDMTATVFVKRTPPESCAVDGIQVASGCTLGKATIRVSEASNGVAGEFHAGERVCTITVRTEVLKQLQEAIAKETGSGITQVAEDVTVRPDAELFEIALERYLLKTEER